MFNEFISRPWYEVIGWTLAVSGSFGFAYTLGAGLAARIFVDHYPTKPR